MFKEEKFQQAEPGNVPAVHLYLSVSSFCFLLCSAPIAVPKTTAHFGLKEPDVEASLLKFMTKKHLTFYFVEDKDGAPRAQAVHAGAEGL